MYVSLFDLTEQISKSLVVLMNICRISQLDVDKILMNAIPLLFDNAIYYCSNKLLS